MKSHISHTLGLLQSLLPVNVSRIAAVILVLSVFRSITGAELPSNFVPGALWKETWLNIPGSTLADLTNSVRFPNAPDQSGPIDRFEIPSNAADDYGVRLSGYLMAPVSGRYTFYLSSDDEGALFLSSDDNPANKRLIAREPQWNNAREWNNGSNQNREPNHG